MYRPAEAPAAPISRGALINSSESTEKQTFGSESDSQKDFNHYFHLRYIAWGRCQKLCKKLVKVNTVVEPR